MLAQSKGLILRCTRYGEADLIVTLLTNEGTRLQLFARSALKSKKRFGGGVLEPTHFIQASYEDRRSRLGGESELHTLREASLIESFSGLRSDYNRLEAALRLVQLVYRLVREGGAHSPELFNLLGNALKEAQTSTQLEKLRVHFEIRLLASQGVLELEGESAHLASLPIAAHASAELQGLDWRGLGVFAAQQLKSYTESGAV